MPSITFKVRDDLSWWGFQGVRYESGVEHVWEDPTEDQVRAVHAAADPHVRSVEILEEED